MASFRGVATALSLALATACGGSSDGAAGTTDAGTDSSSGGTAGSGTGGTGAATGGGAGSAGVAGSAATGGSGGATDCPPDIFAAIDTPCADEGAFCGPPCTDPCQFCNVIRCQGGMWQRLEAHPMPCDDAGRPLCGGKSGYTCPATDYCDYPGDTCGFADEQGSCKPRPTVCDTDCPGVCGCDGQHYCNACNASETGADVNAGGSC